MASKSFIHLISVISLCEGCAVVAWDFHKVRPRHKTIEAIAARLKAKCKSAMNLCPGEVSPRELKVIETRMHETECEAFAGTEQENIISYTSLCLGLLDDLMLKIQDAKRKTALDQIHTAMKALHRYFDKDLNSWDCYERATRAIDVWERRMAA